MGTRLGSPGAANEREVPSAKSLTSYPDVTAVSAGYGPIPPIVAGQSGNQVKATGLSVAVMAHAVWRVRCWVFRYLWPRDP
jgi:hypothetical protein